MLLAAKVGRPNKILVCAPSNAAVDEVVKRLGRPDKHGLHYREYPKPEDRFGKTDVKHNFAAERI